MPLDLNALLSQIDASLGSAVTASVQNSQAINDLYEALLFGLILDAARSIDPNAVTWRNLTGLAQDEVRLRGGPGEIFSPDFSFAIISFDGQPLFELHQGVRIAVLSDVGHECDVALIHAGRGAWRRRTKQRPGAVDLFFALEAKAYSTAAVDLGIARGVVGLRSDLQQHRIALVAATAVDQSAEKLLLGWIAGVFANVMPNSGPANAFVAAMRSILVS